MDPWITGEYLFHHVQSTLVQHECLGKILTDHTSILETHGIPITLKKMYRFIIKKLTDKNESLILANFGTIRIFIRHIAVVFFLIQCNIFPIHAK